MVSQDSEKLPPLIAESTYRILGWNQCYFTRAICVSIDGNKYHPASGDCRQCQIPLINPERAREIIKERVEARKVVP